MRFYSQGKFSWRKTSLCTGMGGEGEIIVHNAAMNQNPKTKAGPTPSLLLFYHIFYINFKHQLLSIFYARTLFQTIFEN